MIGVRTTFHEDDHGMICHRTGNGSNGGFTIIPRIPAVEVVYGG